jgi:hypothetical protein
MGLPALLSTLSELEQEAVEAAAPLPSEGGTQSPIEGLSKQTKMIEHLLARIRPALTKSFAEIEKSAKAVGAGGQQPLEQAIERVGAQEAELAKQFLPMIEAARKLRAETFGARHLSREERTRHVVVLDRHVKALGAILSVFRDERWRIMTLLAEIEPAGDAPVFSDPRQLLEYLQANRK